MFCDERILVEQGKAFRATMILAWFISLIYGLLHTLSMFANGTFYAPALVHEAISIISGLVLFLYGEIKHHASTKDEMVAYKKNNYYKKIFYWYLGIILFAFCLQISLGSRYEWFPPNHFLLTLQIPCWLLLLTYFKFNGVPFNYSYLAEDKPTYIRRTFANVAKLAKIIALATLAGIVVLIVLRASISEFVAVLAAGIISWISLSIEYLIISWAERVSDHANENNRISSATLIFVFIGAIIYIISLGVGSYMVWDDGSNITNGTILMIGSALNKYLGCLSKYFFGLFAVYLYSEMKHIKSRLFDTATIILMGLVIFEFILEPLSQVLHYMVGNMATEIGMTAVHVHAVIDYLILVTQSIVLAAAIIAIIQAKKVKRAAFIYPAVIVLSSVCVHLWAMQSNTGHLVENVVFSILAIWLCVIIISAYRRGKRHPKIM